MEAAFCDIINLPHPSSCLTNCCRCCLSVNDDERHHCEEVDWMWCVWLCSLVHLAKNQVCIWLLFLSLPLQPWSVLYWCGLARQCAKAFQGDVYCVLEVFLLSTLSTLTLHQFTTEQPLGESCIWHTCKAAWVLLSRVYTYLGDHPELGLLCLEPCICVTFRVNCMLPRIQATQTADTCHSAAHNSKFQKTSPLTWWFVHLLGCLLPGLRATDMQMTLHFQLPSSTSTMGIWTLLALLSWDEVEAVSEVVVEDLSIRFLCLMLLAKPHYVWAYWVCPISSPSCPVYLWTGRLGLWFSF